MVARLIFLLPVLVFCSALRAVDNPRPKAELPVVAVTPASPQAGAADSGTFVSELGRSLENHLSHLTTIYGRGVKVRRWDRPASNDLLLDSLSARGVREVLIVRYTGEVGQRTVEVQDGHRRRYRAVVENSLQVEAAYEKWQVGRAGWELIATGTASASGRPGGKTATGQGEVRPGEPYDRVVQRVVERLGELLPSTGPGPARALRAVIPVKIYLGKGLAGDPDCTTSRIRQLVDVADEQLEAQFGVGLRLVSVEALPEWAADGGRLPEGYPKFRRAVRAGGDTLVVAFNRRLTPEEYFDTGWREEIGMARIGQRRVYMDLLPPAFPGDTIWQTMANGLTLLHEIGHALGGIHVSDVNSIMAHRANWVNSGSFDRVNERIIGAALAGQIRFDDPVAYLKAVSGILDSAAYGLADYPSFFHQYLTWGDNPARREALREAIGRKAFLAAADAVGFLSAGQKGAAAQLLKRALREDRDQAALYYYLSLAADGPAALAARRTAERMGYLMARERAGGAVPDTAVDIARTRR